MKKALLACLLAIIVLIAGCGGGGSAEDNSINGVWTATLTPTAGSQITFTDTLALTTPTTVNGATVNLSATGLSISASGCLDASAAQIGAYMVDETTKTNTFQFGMQSDTALLVMQGSMANGKITGTWTLGGTDECMGSGNFIMKKTATSNFPHRS
jgi:hypothetical protein